MSTFAAFDSRRRLIGVGVLVFIITFFSYAHADLLTIFYHVAVDGCLAGVWVFSGWGLGRWVVGSRACGYGAEGDQGQNLLLVQVTRIALGLGIMSLLILLLGLTGMLGEISCLILLAVGFGLGVLTIARWHSAQKNISRSINNWLSTPAGSHWFLLLLAPFAAMMFAGGLVMPGLLWGLDDPSGYDVTEYHLQIPREWFEMGRIGGLHHNVFSYFPFNVEMHYLLAMEVHAGPWAGMFLAQWMHGIFIALTIVAIYAGVRVFASPLAATIAAIAAGVCPWITMLGAVAYDEGGLLLYSTLAIAWMVWGVMQNDMRKPEARSQKPEEIHSHSGFSSHSSFCIHHSAFISGLCAGFACGCKLTAVPILIIALPIIWLVVRPAVRTVWAMLIYIVVALIAFSPWLIRNQIWAHNPVFPEGMTLLGHGHFSAIEVARWHQAHSPRADQQSAAAHLLALWRQILADWHFGYVLFPLSIILAICAIRRRITVFLFGAFVVLILFWILFTHLEGRFFVMGIPIMAMLLATGPAKILRWAAIPICLSAIPAFIFLHQKFYPASTTIGLIESPAIVRSLFYPPQINSALSEDKPVILVGDAKAFWYDIPMSRLHYRTVFDVDTSNNRPTISAWINGAGNLPDANVIIDPGELERFHRTYLGIALSPTIQDLRGTTVVDLHDPLLSN